MTNSPSSSDIVNKEKQPSVSGKVQNKTPQMLERADSASSNPNVASTADNASTSATVLNEQQSLSDRVQLYKDTAEKTEIVPEEQEPLLTENQQSLHGEKEQNETRQMPERADSVPFKGRVASTVDNASTSGLVPEGEEERSLWREKVEHRLRIAKERLKCERNGFQILKVPEWYRHPPEMFAPEGWQFGLHNLDNVDRYSATEALKRCVPLLFGLDEVEKWEKFCDYVVPDHTRMLGCYGLRKEDINLTDKEIKQVLAADALCIAWKIDVWHTKSGEKVIWIGNYVTLPEEEVRMFIRGCSTCIGIFNYDMSKVENQIPLELITRAIEYIETPFSDLGCEPNQTKANGELWMKRAVRLAIQGIMREEDVDGYEQEISDRRLSETHHILDGAYKVICGKDGLKRKFWKTFIHIPSAIQLKHVGVKIEGVAKPLCTMKYNKKTKSLILPKMEIYDDTFSFIQNLAQYEAHVKLNHSMFCDYIFLMLDLIMTPEDMDYLIKCGVINNACGTRAFEKWQELNEGLTFQETSEEHNAMKEDIKRRYDQKLPKLWREFRTLFCSRPWLIVPIIAATLITIATLIQTYAAIIGSDRMMPHYKNP